MSERRASNSHAQRSPPRLLGRTLGRPTAFVFNRLRRQHSPLAASHLRRLSAEIMYADSR